MPLEAMFKCSQVTSREAYAPEDDPAIAIEVELEAVISGEGNESWSKWTPSGKLEMHISNPAAEGFFTPGDEYRLTITKRQPQKART